MEDEYVSPFLCFPFFIERTVPNRQLAYFTDMEIITELDIHIPCASFDEFCSACFAHNLLTFVPSIPDFPYLEEVVNRTRISHPHSTAVMCRENGQPVSIRLRSKRSTRWIIASDVWEIGLLSVAKLVLLRSVYEHAGAGTQTTPAALGLSLMRISWREQYGEKWVEHRHARPNGAAVADLKDYSLGPRSDFFGAVNVKTMIELDIKNAYPKEFAEEPTGKARRFICGNVTRYATYFAHCTVQIREKLVLGPFGMRNPDTKELYYPEEPGVYDTWLWRDEVALCRHEGCLITIHEGWGWCEYTRDTALWVSHMEQLRDTAPSTYAALIIKIAGVSAIGRHGIHQESYILIDEGSNLAHEKVLCEDGNVYNYMVHAVTDYYPTNMQHWFNHTQMRVRLQLYPQARSFREKEQLYGTNVDALYLAVDADVSSYQKESYRSGDWRPKEHTNVSLPVKRHIITDQKRATPGRSMLSKEITDG